MTNQKHVVLTHTNAMGNGGVRINDIEIDGLNVIFTADHGGKLSLPLKNCVKSLTASSMGDTVLLNYFQQPVPMMPGLGGQYGRAMVAVAPHATDYLALVEFSVVALFEHELTTRLIEPLRKVAADMVGSRPQASAMANYCAPRVVVSFNGKKVTSIKMGIPTSDIYTGFESHTVRTARLHAVFGNTMDEVELIALPADDCDPNRVATVGNVLTAYDSAVAGDYISYMDIAIGDAAWGEPAQLFLRDATGEVGHITDIGFTDGLFTFSVASGKQIQIPAEHLGQYSNGVQSLPTYTFGVLDQPVKDAKVVDGVYVTLSLVYQQQAAEYLEYMRTHVFNH